MRKTRLLGTSALGSVAIVGLSMLSAPAYAQVAGAGASDPACQNLPEGVARDGCISGEVEIESGQDASDAGGQEITVTGSRIRRPNLESNVPVTSITADELTSQGDPNIGDALNDLPSLRSTFNQSNSTAFIGTTGLNVLDLRGLGTARTLVLVNGRRHVTSVVGQFTVDTNTIPSDLLERVDIITGGSSAVYGSDAVAGVVNFILKRDFSGFRMRAQAGVSDEGDRGLQFVTSTLGQNFADGRGNVALHLEYANAEPLYFGDRPGLTGAFGGRCQFNNADDTRGEPSTGDGVPDLQFFCGVRNATISNGGAFAALVSPAQCQNPVNTALASRCVNFGTPQGQPRLFTFDRAGNVVENRTSLDFRPFGSGNFIGGEGSTLRDTGQLAPGLDRYTANLLARFELSEAFEPFAEAKYVLVKSLQEGQPSFFQGSFPGFFGGGRGIRCDNPFLTAQNLAALREVGRCTGTTDAALGAQTIFLSRFNVDFGGRSQFVERETLRGVAGVRGNFNDDWNYEVSATYGRTKIDVEARNDLQLFDLQGNEAGFLQATDVIRDPASGQIVCRDPAARAAGCLPINVFGEGVNSQAALDFINTTSFLNSRATQLDVVGFVGGDLSQLFEFPGGPVRFALGAEYRRETAFRIADPLSASGGTFFNAFQPFDPPAFEVKEVFGEVEVPLLRDLPFVHELTLNGAARYSDYNTAADKTFSYNVSGTYAPIRDLRLRANYSRSVRVPTLGDLFFPLSQNFGFVGDPCDVLNIGNNPNRAANCAALGVPAGFVNTVARSQTIEFQSGGNPNLQEETGKSLTLGAVFTPRWVPGLSFTVDYYRIRVENLIATLGAQVIINQCVDLPNINNQFCASIFPRQTDNPATPDNEAGLFAQPALISGGINFAKQQADGVDMEVAYRRKFDNGLRLDVRGIATRVIKRNNFVSPTNPEFSDRQLSELGDPKWAANFSTTIGIGNVDFRYALNYIGKQTIGAYENYFSHQGRPPLNEDFTREVFYPDALYHAARINIKANEQFGFYMGVDNLFDKKPPLGLLGTSGGDPYDSIGRFFYAGATVTLGGIGELLNR